MSSIEVIKKIREMTGLSLKDIKNAVEHLKTEDEDKIITYLREQGSLKMAGRQDRATGHGRIFTYVHEGRIGVMIELRSETDFVSRGDVFKQYGNDICLHVAAMQPMYLRVEDVHQEFVDKEMDIAKKLLLDEGKPADKVDMILTNKLQKIKEEVSLLSQAFFKDSKKTVQDIINEVSQTTGEKIELTRFVLYKI
jgi:elongation factor Ts